MLKGSKLKITSVLLTILMLVSCLAIGSYAVTDQDMAQISVTASNKNPNIGETITVKVSIDNYRTMSKRIAAMLISVSFDTSCFDYVTDSAQSLLKINLDDITSVAFDGNDKVTYAYTYANTKKQTLPTTANEIFSFKLKVKNTIKVKTPVSFTVNDLVIYNGKNETNYSLIECKEPKIDEVTLWPSRPGILLNGSDTNKKTYNENVVVTFDVSSGSLVYEGRQAVSVTSPYICDKNGTYSISVTVNGEKTTQTFTIDKTISHISVKPGTYNTEYPVGTMPDYSAWILLVTYTDGTYSELPMDDGDIDISGYNAGSIGEQRLLIKYKNKTTSVTVKVNSKSVVSFTIQSPISKVEYLKGDDLDVTGGVLVVVYDDATSEEIPITKNMLSGYDSTYVGEQTVNVTYASITQSFRVTYYPREAVDELIMAIDALDLNTISLDSRETMEGLINKYNGLTSLQKSAVTNLKKLEDASERFNDLLKTDTTSDTTTEPTQTTSPVTTDNGGGKTTKNSNIIWYVVAGVIILAVLGGVGYFIFIYFKRKKEIEEEDEYYDDGDFEDDSDDDGDLSYGEDIINLEEEDGDDEDKTEEYDDIEAEEDKDDE